MGLAQGLFCIKESLGEYGSGWGWDELKITVFDYTHVDIDSPVMYYNNIATDSPIIEGDSINYGVSSSSEQSKLCNTETTSHQATFGNTISVSYISCLPHAFNAGNYYNYSSSSAGMSNPANRSVCPKGWTLPFNDHGADYYNLLMYYNLENSSILASNKDTALINYPFSFLHVGYYSNTGTLSSRGKVGNYRMFTERLSHSSTSVDYNAATSGNLGYSLRCDQKKA